MNKLPELFRDKEAREQWSDFIMAVLNEEALERVFKNKDTGALKEVRDIIAKSFKKLDELYTPKKKRVPKEDAV